VAQWFFDTGSGGTVFDSSGNSRNGFLNGGVTWVTGVEGYALEFDGVNDYVSVPSDAGLSMGTSNITLEAWVRLRVGSASNDGIINKGVSWDEGYRMVIEDGPPGKWNIQTHIEDATAGPKQSRRFSADLVSSNVWYHWAVVFDKDDNEYIYIDGVLSQGGHLSDPITDVGSVANGQILQIGTHGAAYVAATIDAVRIYNRALSQAEIQFNMAHPGPLKGTVISIQ
jgi:hypothetical protein